MEDREIIGLCLERREEALAATQAKYGGYCLTVARNILPDPRDAEECVDDAMLALWNSVPPNVPEVLPAYLGKLTRRAALKRWRDKRAQKRGGGEAALALEELGECVPARGGPESEAEARELAAAVNGFILGLRARERDVFICRYWYMMPVADVAARYGFSESKVKSMLQRTRKKLKKYLVEEGVYDGS